MRFLSIVLAGLIASLGLVSFSASAADANLKTVAAVYKDKVSLTGKTVSVQGKVVKVNNGIMGRNWVHVQDATGDANGGNTNLIVTSKQTAKVGDAVTISGLVVLNRDFGSGYSYPLLIEDATASCGCTTPSWTKQPVAPGAQGTMEVQFDSRGKQGIINKQVAVRANTQPSITTIAIKGNVLTNGPTNTPQ